MNVGTKENFLKLVLFMLDMGSGEEGILDMGASWVKIYLKIGTQQIQRFFK